MRKVIQVVGARPNFMKVAPLHRSFQKLKNWKSKIVHTGQHFDKNMSDVFFEQLELPVPDYFLGVGFGSQTKITAEIMLSFEKILENENPDLVIVVGDVTSTLACTLVAIKLGIKVAHVESGLRSFDRTMPEELNRILTDSVSDYLFVTENSAIKNLKFEGIQSNKIFFTGNVMIDSLVYYLNKALSLDYIKSTGLKKNDFVIITMHRPSNVDNFEGLQKILKICKLLSSEKTVFFPIHPRTINNLKTFGLYDSLLKIKNIIISEPLGYLEFLQMVANSYAIITDSGGIQEETTYLGIPCLTFRTSTERPVTVEIGTNFLIESLDLELLANKFRELNSKKFKKVVHPPFWDGFAAERIVNIIDNLFCEKTT